MVAAASEEASDQCPVGRVGDRGDDLVGHRDQPPGAGIRADRRRGGRSGAADRRSHHRAVAGGQRIGDVVKLITPIADRPICWRSTPPSRRRAPAKPAAASRWSPPRSRRWPSRPPRRPARSASRSPASRPRRGNSVGAIKEISGTIERLSEIASTIAAAVEEQGAATQEISRNVQQAALRHRRRSPPTSPTSARRQRDRLGLLSGAVGGAIAVRRQQSPQARGRKIPGFGTRPRF